MTIILEQFPEQDNGPQTTVINGQTLPLLPGFFDGGRQWFVPCNHCQRFHVHGAGPGHRVAHCDRPPAGPYEESGYVLYLAGDYTREIKQAWERRWIDARKAARASKRALKEQMRRARMWERAIGRALRRRRGEMQT